MPPSMWEAAIFLSDCPIPKLVSVRPSTVDDIALLQGIFRNAQQRYASLGPAWAFAVNGPAPTAERFTSGETLVARVDDVDVGYVLLQELDGFLYVANIAVASTARGKGIGATLLNHAQRRAYGQQLKGLTLATFRSPPWNGPWFRRHGYRPLPEGMIGPGLAAVLARHATFLDMTTRETLWKPI